MIDQQIADQKYLENHRLLMQKAFASKNTAFQEQLSAKQAAKSKNQNSSFELFQKFNTKRERSPSNSDISSYESDGSTHTDTPSDTTREEKKKPVETAEPKKKTPSHYDNIKDTPKKKTNSKDDPSLSEAESTKSSTDNVKDKSSKNVFVLDDSIKVSAMTPITASSAEGLETQGKVFCQRAIKIPCCKKSPTRPSISIL